MGAMDADTQLGYAHTVIAVLMDTMNKYTPGVQRFYIQAMTPSQNKLSAGTKTQPDLSNIMNADPGALHFEGAKIGATVELEVPKEVARWFEIKFIPPGTRFVVAFTGGDISKPRIVGRDYKTEQGGYNDPSAGGDANNPFGGITGAISNATKNFHF